MGYDQNFGFLQYAAGQSSYNWDCCGVSVEYRHIDVPGVNVENQYRFCIFPGEYRNLRQYETAGEAVLAGLSSLAILCGNRRTVECDGVVVEHQPRDGGSEFVVDQLDVGG